MFNFCQNLYIFVTGATDVGHRKDKTWQPENTYIDVVNPFNQVNQKDIV